jgi:intracellular sulfur oxidation DsrE/DsrF family protein
MLLATKARMEPACPGRAGAMESVSCGFPDDDEAVHIVCPFHAREQENAMNRRNILWSALSALGAGFAASRARAATETVPTGKLKVVYHLSDLDKVNFVVGNIQNHLDGVGGPDHVTIALVVHGPALKAFHSTQASPDLSKRVGQFSKEGLELAACGNTMKAQNVTLQDLLPGFVSADKGGVVRIAELQAQGYLYLRP